MRMLQAVVAIHGYGAVLILIFEQQFDGCCLALDRDDGILQHFRLVGVAVDGHARAA